MKYTTKQTKGTFHKTHGRLMNEHLAGGFPRQALFGPAVAAADCFEGRKKREKKAAFVQHMGAFIVEEKRMIDLLVARFERAFFFFHGIMVAVDGEGEGLRGAERGPRTFTQGAQRGLNRRDDHRGRPPTVR